MWSAWQLRHALSFDTGTTSALSTSPCISLRINDHNVAGGMKVDLTLIPMRGPVCAGFIAAMYQTRTNAMQH